MAHVYEVNEAWPEKIILLGRAWAVLHAADQICKVLAKILRNLAGQIDTLHDSGHFLGLRDNPEPWPDGVERVCSETISDMVEADPEP